MVGVASESAVARCVLMPEGRCTASSDGVSQRVVSRYGSDVTSSCVARQ